MYYAACLTVLLVAYLVNIVTITVGYHRGLAHSAVRIRPWARRALVATGNWVTGLDPKAWCVMHRMHHAHSDTQDDPHSPVNVGIWGIPKEQLRSYERTLRGLAKQKPEFTAHAKGLDFELNWMNRAGLWYLPYVVHALVGLVLGLAGFWLLGLCYFVGMMSHPVQGGLVNSLGHALGGRNFDTDDNSRNNLFAAWLIFGEGFQNNHHQFPASAKFSYQPWEVDMGWGSCLVLEKLGVLDIERPLLIPAPVTEPVET